MIEKENEENEETEYYEPTTWQRIQMALGIHFYWRKPKTKVTLGSKYHTVEVSYWRGIEIYQVGFFGWLSWKRYDD